MLKTPNTYFLLFLFLVWATPVVAQNITEIELANQYLDQGENDKALLLFEKLVKNSKNIPLVHDNYFQLLLINARLDDAESYIDKAIKQFPSDLSFKIDKGLIYAEQNNKAEQKKYYDKLIDQISANVFGVRIAAQQFIKNHQYEYAVSLYAASRKKLNQPTAYAIQMASLYRVLNMNAEMIDEYLNYSKENPDNLSSIKNILQNVLTEDEELEMFEQKMFDNVQREPDNLVYSELLIWVNLQRKNFYSAFVQARAIDKRHRLNGSEVMELGRITMVNKDYKNALKIFEYIIETYPGTPNDQIARRLVIASREEMVKNTFPVERREIEKLIEDYQQLIQKSGLNQYTVEAMRSQALLYAFYLNEHDAAIAILQQIINTPRISKSIIDQSKLDLGDIYILIGQPWESTLLYSQVEKSSKDTPIAYDAKLRNAKLSYYRGDFALAQNHLDILKMATTREISNDALALSLLIKDNTKLDTGDIVMKRYAAIELMIFQNKKNEALEQLEQLKTQFPEHPLADEILFLQAKLNMEMGKFQQAIDQLNAIVDQFGTDILGDDALYQIGTIYEDKLKDRNKAKEIFQHFIITYPGSNKAADARKRFRTLRGDNI